MPRLSETAKKLDGQDRENNNSTIKKDEEWTCWLQFLKKFLSCCPVATVLGNKSDRDVRPYVEVIIGKFTYQALLDSGSTFSILGNNAHLPLLDTGFNMDMSDQTSFIAAGGQLMQAIGSIRVPISLADTTHSFKLYVAPAVTTSLILGVDFWTKFSLLPKNINFISLLQDAEVHNPVNSADVYVHSYNLLTPQQRISADNVISQFHSISSERCGLGRTNMITHQIDTGDSPPIRQRYYRMSPEKQRILCEQLEEMLKLDVVEPCESAWSSPVLLVPKKDGQVRFCLDSRKLNSVTKKDAYSLPYISEILDNLKDAKYLTSIDLYKSFWQLPIKQEDKQKTAFYIPTKGTFCFKTTPFGLTNAPATQQRLVDMLFSGPEFESRVFVYLDDVVIVSSTFDQHIALLLKVLKKLEKAKLTINFKKSQFFREELKYLGYVVNSKGLQVDPDKVEAILKFPAPTNKKEVKRFLGTASWYRRFVPNFSTLAGPLNKLTTTSKKRSETFVWTPECEEAFTKLKNTLVSAPVLSCPDFSQPFQVHTDASNYGVGGLLTQVRDGVEHPVAYMSKSLSPPERNYSITERETLAVILALEHWRCYLENGKQFTVYTDHAALKWFVNLQNPTGRLARWGVRLSSFNLVFRHRRGVDNVIPDALSRAVPVSAIGSNTTDEWYLNIFNGCKASPTSFPNFIIKDDVLYRFTKSKYALNTEFEWKEVVPAESREQVIIENHATPMAGHLGVFKTVRRIRQRYFWPGMHADVYRIVSQCDQCIAHKQANHPPLGEMGRPKSCSRPFAVVSVDLVGPLPPSRRQNTFILVVHCCFSKYTLVFPIRRATAEVVTKIMEDQVFLVHGIPSTVILDNGNQFISTKLKSLFDKYRVPHVHYTPKYTPQVNSVERYNKTIIQVLSTFIDSDQRSWDLWIPAVQFALNNSVSEVTGFTPSFLVYGRELVTCGSHYLDVDTKDIIFQPRDSYADNLGELSEIFDKVQSLLLQSHSRNAGHYNLRRKPADFNEGDIVWKRTFLLSDKDKFFTKKLAPKFIKCRIIKKKSPLVYELADMSGKSIGNWHIKDFKMVNYKP